MKEENEELKNFVAVSENTGEIDLKNVVVAANPISRELLERISAKKALEDIILTIESRFRDGRINL